MYYRYGTEYTDLFDFVERLKYPLDGWRVPLTRAVRNPEVSALGMAFVNCIPWLNCTLIQSQCTPSLFFVYMREMPEDNNCFHVVCRCHLS